KRLFFGKSTWEPFSLHKVGREGELLLLRHVSRTDPLFPDSGLSSVAWVRAVMRANNWVQTLFEGDVNRKQVVIDDARGEIIVKGTDIETVTSDGLRLLTSNDSGAFLLWDLPPRYPWLWLLTL